MGIQNSLDDFTHGMIETAGCIHLQDYHRAISLGTVDAAFDEFLGYGSDRPIDLDHVGLVTPASESWFDSAIMTNTAIR